MLRDRLNKEQAAVRLYGMTRNMMTAPNTTFTPWQGLDLAFREGNLMKVWLYQATPEFSPLASLEDVWEMTPMELLELVEGVPQW